MNSPLAARHAERATAGAEMLDRIEALQPLFRDNAEKARLERRVPQENIDALVEAGFFLALQPAEWGGYELDPQDFFRMQMAIARACMSTAWAGGIVAVHAFQIALMDRRAQQDVENIAHTPDEQPATKMLLTQGAPQAAIMASEITAMIDIESAHSLDAIHKTNIMSDLRSVIGYGGMIHQFKNFVLRQDTPRIEKVRGKIAAAREAVARYRQFELTAAERAALEKFVQARVVVGVDGEDRAEELGPHEVVLGVAGLHHGRLDEPAAAAVTGASEDDLAGAVRLGPLDGGGGTGDRRFDP